MPSESYLIEKAKIAETAERYDDMVCCVTELVEMGVNLTEEQRNLLSVAFKNVVGARRSAWRIVSSMEAREEGEKSELVKAYRKQIEDEIEDRCTKVLKLLDDHLIKNADDATNPVEAKVFYWKMKGDYYRYLVEFATGEEKSAKAKQSEEAYNEAFTFSSNLPNVHPIKLGLALNFSVFYYEIRNDPENARQLAKKAFDDAIADMDHLDEDVYRDSTMIMQLLRDNLTLWSSGNDELQE